MRVLINKLLSAAHSPSGFTVQLGSRWEGEGVRAGKCLAWSRDRCGPMLELCSSQGCAVRAPEKMGKRRRGSSSVRRDGGDRRLSLQLAQLTLKSSCGAEVVPGDPRS